MQAVIPNPVPVDTCCRHCGESCNDQIIRYKEEVFCCEGCKTVYQILSENQLCQFYSIDEAAGISQKNRSGTAYAYMDDPEIIDQLVDFQSEERIKLSFLLPDIHCASCIWLLENLHVLNKGVLESKVNFLRKTLSLQISRKETSIRQIADLLDRLGYPPKITLASRGTKSPSKVNQRFALQAGVAGFVFGNIMLMSFPEYLGLEQSVFSSLFGYLNLALVIPAIVFSARDYWYSAWLSLKQKRLNIDVPIILGILALFFRSLYEILSHTGAGYLDSLAGLILFLLAGKWFQQKTYHYLSFERDYKSYFPLAVTKVDKKGQEQISLDKLKEGDRILIRNQQVIPADGILMQGEALIDYSFVTGESDPVAAKNGDKLFAGGRQLGPGIEIEVLRKVSQSYLTQLWNESSFKEEEKGSSTELADRFGAAFTKVILAVAAGTFAWWSFTDMGVAVNAASAVLIVACPCAIALSIPFTYGNVLRILSRHRFFLKNIRVIEALQDIRHLVFDKTGTLTSSKGADLQFIGRPLNDAQKAMIKSLVYQSSHPLSRQIADHLNGVTVTTPEDFSEISGQGLSGRINGHTVKVGSPKMVGNIPDEEQKGVHVKIDENVLGYFSVNQQIRPGLADTLKTLKNIFAVSLLSGDNAREKVLFEPYFQTQQMRFNNSPKDKLQYIQSLQEDGSRVAMIGDGLNDAGALKQADAGIVITEDINNFTPSSDAILDAAALNQFPVFLSFIRQSKTLIYGAYGLALIYNIIGLSYAMQGLLSPLIAAILMPLSSITIVAFGVLSSSFLAWKLGIKNSDPYHFSV